MDLGRERWHKSRSRKPAELGTGKPGRGLGFAKHLINTIEMMASIPALLIQFGLQTLFLLAALWIMIKVQKLDYHFLGLVGSAALASAIDLIPLPFHVTDLISCSVLLVCISKVTGSEYVDVMFTVFVGYALMFGMNLWLLGTMMADLRPSAIAAENQSVPEAVLLEEDAPATPEAAAIPGNRERLQPPAKAATTASAPEQTGPAAKPTSATTPGKPLPRLSVKALTRNGAKSSVTLESGQRPCTLFLGDSEVLQTADGKVDVHFDELTPQWIVLTVAGQPVKVAAP